MCLSLSPQLGVPLKATKCYDYVTEYKLEKLKRKLITKTEDDGLITVKGWGRCKQTITMLAPFSAPPKWEYGKHHVDQCINR